MSRHPRPSTRVRPTPVAVHDDADMNSVHVCSLSTRLRSSLLYKASDQKNLAPCRLDDLFHPVEVALQGPASRGAQPVFGLRHAPFEVLVALHVARLFQFASVDTEVPVGRLQDALQFVEAELIVYGQRTDDAQPNALVDHRIQFVNRPLRTGATA